MVCLAHLEAVPDDLVFVTYVRLDYSSDDEHVGRTNPHSTRGVITHWQFVEADVSTRSLPIDDKERYRKRLW
jgi:hypothetical protein